MLANGVNSNRGKLFRIEVTLRTIIYFFHFLQEYVGVDRERRHRSDRVGSGFGRSCDGCGEEEEEGQKGGGQQVPDGVHAGDVLRRRVRGGGGAEGAAKVRPGGGAQDHQVKDIRGGGQSVVIAFFY